MKFMKYLILAILCLSLVTANEVIVYSASFNDSQIESISETVSTTGKSAPDAPVTAINSITIGKLPEHVGRVDVILTVGDTVTELVDISSGKHELNIKVEKTSVKVEAKAYVFPGFSNVFVAVLLNVSFASNSSINNFEVAEEEVEAQNKPPYGNLPLRVQEYNEGKGVSYVGVVNINHKGQFNAATYTAKVTGNVEIKVASVNANGNMNEIVVFKKQVKQGESYLVDHKPIKSNGIFIVSTTVRGAKAPKGSKAFGAGVLTYAVVK